MFNIPLSIEVFIFVIFVLGLFLGQAAYFLICIFEGRRTIHPYKCPSCCHFIGFVPVLSRLLNHGKCKKCLRKLDFRCTVVEILMGMSFVGIFLFVPSSWFVFEIAIFCFMSIIACAVDIKRTILPDTFTLGGIVIAFAGAFFNPERDFFQALTGALLGGGILALVSYCYYLLRKTEGIGGGDIKMIAWIGGLVGIHGIFYVILISCIIGFLWNLFLCILNYKKVNNWMKQEIPFGPYLAFSTYVFILMPKNFLNF